jgi:hypothetical protein
MKKIFLALVVLVAMVRPVYAQMVPPEATLSGEIATPAGIVEKKIEEKTDLTQPTVEVKSKLRKVIEDNPVGELSYTNFLRYIIERAVKQGVPANTLVLIILFPLAVTMVAASRHLLGIRGTGILSPALLSIAFLATGVWAGVVLFVIILVVTVISRSLLSNFRLQYLPRVALLLWFVSAGVLCTMVLAGEWQLSSMTEVGIFPILILMLLAETFIDLQSGRSASEARQLIFQTFALAMLTSLILGWEVVQQMVLLFPEAIFLGVAGVDILMGKYTGLRLSEYIMFRQVAQGDEEE